ncbi:hypothetical protein J2S09_001945 [Bacillus fengqiuensis]|nr:hypothetical protein [Bacillus fengqiuensis]
MSSMMSWRKFAYTSKKEKAKRYFLLSIIGNYAKIRLLLCEKIVHRFYKRINLLVAVITFVLAAIFSLGEVVQKRSIFDMYV